MIGEIGGDSGDVNKGVLGEAEFGREILSLSGSAWPLSAVRLSASLSGPPAYLVETVRRSACHPLGGPLSLSRWGPSLIPSLFLPEIVQGRPAYLAEPLSLIGPPPIPSPIGTAPHRHPPTHPRPAPPPGPKIRTDPPATLGHAMND